MTEQRKICPGASKILKEVDMNCPSCGAPEKTLVKYCQTCGEAFASQDLAELGQLEFLLNETASWGVAEKLRQPYIGRLQALRSRLQRHGRVAEKAPAAAVSPPASESVTQAASEVAPIRPAHPRRSAPRKEPVPFDQWLLSERNIKIALYTGGLLLMLAGVIFVSVNWARLPGPAKFAVTLLTTGLLYLGGSLLFRRPMLRLGAIALLALASGFLSLNFAVLQIYVLGPRGMPADVMWLVASPLCLLPYTLTTYWTRSALFTCISLAALGSTVAAALVVLDAPFLTFVLAAGLLALVLLGLARLAAKTGPLAYAYLPITITSIALVSLAFIAAFSLLFGRSVFETAPVGSPWLALVSLFLVAAFYGAAAHLWQSKWFTYLGLASAVSVIAGLLLLVEAPAIVFVLAGGLLALVLIGLEQGAGRAARLSFAGGPFLVVAHLLMPVVFIAAIIAWIASTGCAPCPAGSPWLALLAMALGVLFYVINDALRGWIELRWIAAALLALTFTLALVELNFSHTALAISLMLLAVLYLGTGYLLERKGGKRSAGWPLYAAAYVIALVVTALAIESTRHLIKVLVGDVILLALSARVHRDHRWAYAAAWLFILPVYLLVGLLVSALHYQGLLMGLLCLIYAGAGYLLGRRQLRLGAPCLTAAAFLAILAVVLAWQNSLVVSSLLLSVVVLYLLAALWLGWQWLLLPALLALQLAVYVIGSLYFAGPAALLRALIISYFALGALLASLGAVLRRAAKERWIWPLYLVGAINLAGAYLFALEIGGWLAIGLSALFAAFLLVFAWLERAWFAGHKLPPVLSYAGIAAAFVGHFYLIFVALPPAAAAWPAYTAALCALFVILAWVVKPPLLVDLYGTPLRRAGLWLLAMPLAASWFLSNNPTLAALTYAIAGVVFTSDAALRRILGLAYLGIGAFVVMVWALLLSFAVPEFQAYAIPLGFALLGIGWNERLQRRRSSYRILTLLGLLVLLGSAFVQSLPRAAYSHALLLLFESFVAVGWGIRTRSRGYVQLGSLALIADALVQLGPAFIELQRWIQLGVTGAILLGAGLAALIKRQQILEARQRLTEELRHWEA